MCWILDQNLSTTSQTDSKDRFYIVKTWSKLYLTCKLSFTSFSKADEGNLGMEPTASDINLPILLSGSIRPSWYERIKGWMQFKRNVTRNKREGNASIPQHHQHICECHRSRPIDVPLMLPSLLNQRGFCRQQLPSEYQLSSPELTQSSF